MNTDELFNIIGKLYVDLYNIQKVIEILQKQVKDKDLEIQNLKKIRTKDD
jgi:hypothetical protein